VLARGLSVVDLLCHIPAHIAIGCENQFVPLTDSVLSAELEQSLGAEVNKIVEKLSFWWYELAIKSYMASKVSMKRFYSPGTKCKSFLIISEGHTFPC
jgi:hypothetical protein